MIQIIHADVIEGLRQIPDQTVQCVVTSPPYWGLRDYGVEGQIGLEETPEAYVARLVEVFREVRRVLKDDGTLWLNLGDSYAGSGKGAWDRTDVQKEVYVPKPRGREASMPKVPPGLKPKDLVGIPWRVAFALQADGWYLRSDIIWSKPNPMPESVTDRPTKSHEYIFLLTKKPRYYYDADAVREELKPESQSRYEYGFSGGKRADRDGKKDLASWNQRYDKLQLPAGRNRRTVWEIATQPFPMAHFATFPEALVEPCIKAGTSERGCCSVCGAPWKRVVEKTNGEPTGGHKGRGFIGIHGPSNMQEYTPCRQNVKTLGWQPSCSCNADAVPCIVLDPFGGSGTVGKVARDLNRKAILIELNAEYIKIAKERLRLNEQLGALA